MFCWQPFYSPQFVGTWYVQRLIHPIIDYIKLFTRNIECEYWEFSEIVNGSVAIHVFNRHKFGNYTYTVVGDKTYVFVESKFCSIRIIDTDYTNYSIMLYLQCNSSRQGWYRNSRSYFASQSVIAIFITDPLYIVLSRSATLNPCVVDKVNAQVSSKGTVLMVNQDAQT